MGSRLRCCGFDADYDEAGNKLHHPQNDNGQDSSGSCKGLSWRLLVIADGAATDEPFPGDGKSRQWPQRQYENAKPMAQPAEVRLQFLSSARQPADAHIGRRL